MPESFTALFIDYCQLFFAFCHFYASFSPATHIIILTGSRGKQPMSIIKKGLYSTLLVSTSILLSSQAQADGYSIEAGDWLVRGRIIQVKPDDRSSTVSSGTPLASIAGSGVGVTDDWTPELDFTYMLHRNWGMELILGYSQHDVPARGVISGLGDIIDAKALPPTLTLQYHFLPGARFRPYAGLGINYTYFFDEKVTGGLDAPGAKVEMDDSWGLAAQVGADFSISKDWFLNADLKYIDMETRAHFKNTAVGAAQVDVDIDPWVFGVGIGYRF
jgi:outer membrane protein